MVAPILNLMIQQKAVHLLLLLPLRRLILCMSWNVLAVSPVGNPAKSIVVNNVIMIVKKKEVRRQGKRSQVRKLFTKDEYEFVGLLTLLLLRRRDPTWSIILACSNAGLVVDAGLFFRTAR